MRFSVHVLPPPVPADPAGPTVRVSLSELGLSGRWRVRDLWEHRDVGAVESDLAPIVAWHGAVLYRLSPRP